VVTLPLAMATAVSEQASPPRADEAVAAQRILVVDDNADACEMLRLALGQAGHELAVAADGPGALAIAPGFRPSVGVLDIGLPGMDGYDLARRLRAACAHSIDCPDRLRPGGRSRGGHRRRVRRPLREADHDGRAAGADWGKLRS
jgi:hypothetical protein